MQLAMEEGGWEEEAYLINKLHAVYIHREGS